MIVAGWAWDDRLLAISAFGMVWRLLAMWLLADALFVWVLWWLASGDER